MHLGGDIGPNMGTTVNKIACATNGWKHNSASHIYSSKKNVSYWTFWCPDSGSLASEDYISQENVISPATWKDWRNYRSLKQQHKVG
ncbi:hypothetical protein E2C01_029974 [Portunus trituberculatus]|uniref:Uncharacterized protein n=1 Tax=Portunus trituberculatus TaxID=210409 RepID=A0A5B7EW15_PORTR|nr:hypothetical protein [Portunus trituberculatus]